MLFWLLIGEEQSGDCAYQSVNSKGCLFCCCLFCLRMIHLYKHIFQIVPKLLWRNLLCHLTMRCWQVDSGSTLLHFKLTLSDIRELLKRSCMWGWQAWVDWGRHMRLLRWEPGSWPLISFVVIACLFSLVMLCVAYFS